MNVETLKTIVLVLLALSVIWFVRILVKRETENIVRTLVVCLILGGALFYLQQLDLKTLTLADIRAQIKDALFPEKMPDYIFQKEESGDATGRYTRYFFESPGPKLSLELDPSGKYFNIKDIYSVNRILVYLGLPKVTHTVPELASITGSAGDIEHYRWDDYPRGVLTIVRDICQDRDKLESYQCISNIIISTR